MELYLLVASADKVIDYVGGRSIAAGTAEPLAASQASNNGAWIVYAAVAR